MEVICGRILYWAARAYPAAAASYFYIPALPECWLVHVRGVDGELAIQARTCDIC